PARADESQSHMRGRGRRPAGGDAPSVLARGETAGLRPILWRRYLDMSAPWIPSNVTRPAAPRSSSQFPEQQPVSPSPLFSRIQRAGRGRNATFAQAGGSCVLNDTAAGIRALR